MRAGIGYSLFSAKLRTGYVLCPISAPTLVEAHKRERLLWHCLLHVVNHGTQHRSEAAAILTGYGRSPGDLDFTAFLNEQHG